MRTGRREGTQRRPAVARGIRRRKVAWHPRLLQIALPGVECRVALRNHAVRPDFGTVCAGTGLVREERAAKALHRKSPTVTAISFLLPDLMIARASYYPMTV
jgi:hypothetical protein